MFKLTLKKILKLFGWKLIKKQKNLYYNLITPNNNILDTLKNCKGILHIGAHRAQEAPIYNWFGKRVIWVEANPFIFDDLKDEIKKYSYQKAYLELLSNESCLIKNFFLSNNDYASSSIYEFGKLSEGPESLWPSKNLKMIKKIKLKTITFDDFVKKYKIDLTDFDHWVIDIQGAELNFLNGAIKNIHFCKSMLIEISKGDVYKKGSNWNDVKFFLEKNFFKAQSEPKSDHSDILFLK